VSGPVKSELEPSQRLVRYDDCAFLADRDWNACEKSKTSGRKLCVSACAEERCGAVRKSLRETGLEEPATERHGRALRSKDAQPCVGFESAQERLLPD
jgi:hypothetical protein